MSAVCVSFVCLLSLRVFALFRAVSLSASIALLCALRLSKYEMSMSQLSCFGDNNNEMFANFLLILLVVRSNISNGLLIQPTVEWARFVANSKIRGYLKDRLSKEGCDSRRGWIRAFERWQLMDLCITDTQKTPLFTANVTGNDLAMSYLQQDLANLEGMDVDMANNVIRDFKEYVNEVSSKFNILSYKLRRTDTIATNENIDLKKLKKTQLQVLLKEKDLSTDGLKEDLITRLLLSRLDDEDGSKDIAISEENGVMTLKLEPYQRKPFYINKDVYKKLASSVTNQHSATKLIYCLLARYEALEGVSFPHMTQI